MRAAVHSLSLYVGLVPLLLHLTSATTSSAADNDGIPEVGIGAVHPICDPSVTECVSSDEEVQDDIVAGLEENEEVTGGCRVLAVSGYLCASVQTESTAVYEGT